MDIKLDKLMKIHAELYSKLAPHNGGIDTHYTAINAICESLELISNGTRFENEVKEMINLAEPHLFP